MTFQQEEELEKHGAGTAGPPSRNFSVATHPTRPCQPGTKSGVPLSLQIMISFKGHFWESVGCYCFDIGNSILEHRGSAMLCWRQLRSVIANGHAAMVGRQFSLSIDRWRCPFLLLMCAMRVATVGGWRENIDGPHRTRSDTEYCLLESYYDS